VTSATPVVEHGTHFQHPGVTDGNLVGGVRRAGAIIRTESIVLRARSGTVRRITSEHLAERWLD
jgi:fructose-1,6-bisphosphatase II